MVEVWRGSLNRTDEYESKKNHNAKEINRQYSSADVVC